MRHALKAAIAAAGLVAGAAHAAAVNVVGVSVTGAYGNSPSLVSDGVFPAEGTSWNGATNLYWSGQEGASGVVTTLTFDKTYLLANAEYSLDNNDAYRIQVSQNGADWFTLIRVESYDGNVIGGMDTFSTIPTSLDYVEDQAFAPTLAKYARVFARGGDGFYAVGELKFYGTPAVPEPESVALALAGVGVVGMLSRRRAVRR